MQNTGVIRVELDGLGFVWGLVKGIEIGWDGLG